MNVMESDQIKVRRYIEENILCHVSLYLQGTIGRGQRDRPVSWAECAKLKTTCFLHTIPSLGVVYQHSTADCIWSSPHFPPVCYSAKSKQSKPCANSLSLTLS